MVTQKIIVFHTDVCPKVFLSLYDPAAGKGRGVGMGKGVVSATFKVC